MIEIDRGDLLRLGAGGLVVAAAGGLVPATAVAQLPAPAPKDDDFAVLAFATVAERASRDFYRAAAAAKGSGFSPAERRHLNRVASAKRAHILRLDAALGEEAPLTEDFVTVLPPDSVKTRAAALKLGEQLETLLVRVYINGIGYLTDDPATRLLAGRLLTYDAQALAWLRLKAGKETPAGLYSPIDLDPAGEALDGFLTTPDFEG